MYELYLIMAVMMFLYPGWYFKIPVLINPYCCQCKVFCITCSVVVTTLVVLLKVYTMVTVVTLKNEKQVHFHLISVKTKLKTTH